MSNEAYTAYALYEVGFLLFSIGGSFEPLAPEPYVAHQCAKGAKEKR
jgi:hypothetical protein